MELPLDARYWPDVPTVVIPVPPEVVGRGSVRVSPSIVASTKVALLALTTSPFPVVADHDRFPNPSVSNTSWLFPVMVGYLFPPMNMEGAFTWMFPLPEEIRMSEKGPVAVIAKSNPDPGFFIRGVVMEVVKVGDVCRTTDPVPVAVVDPVPPFRIGSTVPE